MTIHIECHRCKKKYKASNKMEGRQFRCQKCGEMLDVVELLPIVEPEKPSPPVVAPQPTPAALLFPQAAAPIAYPQAPVVPPQAAYPQAAYPQTPVADPQAPMTAFPQASPVAYPQAPGAAYPQAMPQGMYPPVATPAGYPQMPMPTGYPQSPAPPGANPILDLMNEDFAAQATAAPLQSVYSAYQSPAASPFDSEYEKPKRRKKKRRRSSSGEVEVPWAALWVGFLILVGTIFVAGYVAPGVMSILALLVFGVCILTAFGCAIWLQVIAFQEDVLCGILCVVVPFYALYYVLSRWDQCKTPFCLILFSYLVLFTTSCLGGIGAGFGGNLPDESDPFDRPGQSPRPGRPGRPNPFTQIEPRPCVGDPVSFGLALVGTADGTLEVSVG